MAFPFHTDFFHDQHLYRRNDRRLKIYLTFFEINCFLLYIFYFHTGESKILKVFCVCILFSHEKLVLLNACILEFLFVDIYFWLWSKIDKTKKNRRLKCDEMCRQFVATSSIFFQKSCINSTYQSSKIQHKYNEL